MDLHPGRPSWLRSRWRRSFRLHHEQSGPSAERVRSPPLLRPRARPAVRRNTIPETPPPRLPRCWAADRRGDAGKRPPPEHPERRIPHALSSVRHVRGDLGPVQQRRRPPQGFLHLASQGRGVPSGTSPFRPDRERALAARVPASPRTKPTRPARCTCCPRGTGSSGKAGNDVRVRDPRRWATETCRVDREPSSSVARLRRPFDSGERAPQSSGNIICFLHGSPRRAGPEDWDLGTADGILAWLANRRALARRAVASFPASQAP